MTTDASWVGVAHRRPARQDLIVIGAIAAALVVGGLSAARPTWAVGLVVVAVAGALIVSDVHMLPPLLVVAVFAEGVTVGGFSVGRITGPLALAVVLCYLLVAGRAGFRFDPLLVVGGLLGVWILLSYYWAPDSHYVLVWFLRWALSFGFAVAFIVLVQEERHVYRIVSMFVLAAVVFGVIGLLTYLGSGGRGSGLTGDPNQFATYEALAVPAGLVLAADQRGPQRRLLFYGAFTLITLAVVASFSRGGLLSLAVVVAATLAVRWRAFFRSAGQKLVYVFVLGFVAWIVLLFGATAYLDRIGTIFTGQGRGAGRTDLWAAAWTGYRENPYLGLGGGGFEAQSLNLLHTTPGVDISASYIGADRPVHNAYLESLVDLGPLGLALFVLLVALTLFYFARAARRFRAAERTRLWRMSTGLAVSYLGLALSLVFLSIELGHMLWIFVGLACALDRMSARALESRLRSVSEIGSADVPGPDATRA
jgi:O-antigen ligase